MINIEEMNFQKGTLEFIKGAEEIFRQISIQEGEEMQLSEWIEDNIKSVESDHLFDGFTEREKYLFCLGIFNGLVSDEVEFMINNSKI